MQPHACSWLNTEERRRPDSLPAAVGRRPKARHAIQHAPRQAGDHGRLSAAQQAQRGAALTTMTHICSSIMCST